MRCNICGSASIGPLNGDGEFPACAACGSELRQRAVALLLSRALFGCDIALCDFPQLKSIRGLGISDLPMLARPLERFFTYTNTYYHQEPSLDLTEPPPPELGLFDFLICSEVLEHVMSPVSRAFEALSRLLKPTGFLLLTVPFGLGEQTEDHFPTATALKVTEVDGKLVAVGHYPDGSYRVHDNLVFHGGHGATLELRLFSETELKSQLASAGFTHVSFLCEGNDGFGVAFPSPCSLPILASKTELTLIRPALAELVQSFATQEVIIRAAAGSKWLRLGRALGLGPRLGQ